MEIHTLSTSESLPLHTLARRFGVSTQSLLVRNPSLQAFVLSGDLVPPGTFCAPKAPSVSSFTVVTRNSAEEAEVTKRASVVAAIYKHCGRLHKDGEVVGVPQLLLPNVQDVDTTMPVIETDTLLSDVVKQFSIDFDSMRVNGGISVDVKIFGGCKKWTKAKTRDVELRSGTLTEIAMSKGRGRPLAQVKRITGGGAKCAYNAEFNLEQVVLRAGTQLPKLQCNYNYTQSREGFRMSRLRAGRHKYELPRAFALPHILSEVKQAPLPDQGVAESTLLSGHQTVGIHTIVASRGVDVHIVSLFAELNRVLVYVPGVAAVPKPPASDDGLADLVDIINDSDSEAGDPLSPRALAQTLLELGDC